MALHTLVKLYSVHQVHISDFRVASDMANAYMQADVVRRVGNDQEIGMLISVLWYNETYGHVVVWENDFNILIPGYTLQHI